MIMWVPLIAIGVCQRFVNDCIKVEIYIEKTLVSII